MKVGIDILCIERIKNIADDPIRLSTLFTDKEMKYFARYKQPYEHVAGAFCVKEAVAKALGTGFNDKIRPLNIEVLHDSKNAPYIYLLHEAKEYFESMGYKEISISISHDRDIATAICIIN